MTRRLGRRNMADLRAVLFSTVCPSVRVAFCEVLEQLQPHQPRVLLGGALDELSVGRIGREDPVRQRMQREAYGRRPLAVDEEEIRVVARPPLELTESPRGARRKLEVLD